MDRKGRLFRGLAGAAIALATAATLFVLFYLDARTAAAKARGLSGTTTYFMLVAPFLFIYGVVSAVRGFLGAASVFSRRTLFFTGALMLIAGACPWSYTGFIIGGSRGNEGAGMLGTLIFLFVGVPGCILTLVGFVAGWLHED